MTIYDTKALYNKSLPETLEVRISSGEIITVKSLDWVNGTSEKPKVRRRKATFTNKT